MRQHENAGDPIPEPKQRAEPEVTDSGLVTESDRVKSAASRFNCELSHRALPVFPYFW
jgi:hypothetical protein